MTVANRSLRKEDVLNEAWKVLGLPEIMRQKSYRGADDVEDAIADTIDLLIKKDHKREVFERIYGRLSYYSTLYNYDSGKRLYLIDNK
ncbi:MAG: hypothetical protein HY831_02190 [Candidatus Aenigmarchaeota archaeon]|nr:hypothetical protein [Candidatus Aenigmarchaeota archaeon]